jgi:hypothetical protein
VATLILVLLVAFPTLAERLKTYPDNATEEVLQALRVRTFPFDYHPLGMGMRYSDGRQVTGALAEPAAAAFWRVYGPVNPQEKVIDKPLSTLHSLLVATERPSFPNWAKDSRQRALRVH